MLLRENFASLLKTFAYNPAHLNFAKSVNLDPILSQDLSQISIHKNYPKMKGHCALMCFYRKNHKRSSPTPNGVFAARIVSQEKCLRDFLNASQREISLNKNATLSIQKPFHSKIYPNHPGHMKIFKKLFSSPRINSPSTFIF